MKTKIHLVFLIAIFPFIAAAQESPDTTKTDSVSGGTTLPDSLFERGRSGAEKSFEQMQKRMEEFKEAEKFLPRLSFYDSLIVYLASERFNRRDDITQSIYRDAGDYFKFEPSFFELDYQPDPMRKTVQPFGLYGNRLNVISNGQSYTPFEHIVEPDGMIDMNDIPTALDGSVYIIPGPMGQMFGGESNIATLVTAPQTADSNKPFSSFMADRGNFGYAFVRGAYSRKFSNGKQIDLTASSRKGDGIFFGRNDSQGHYTIITKFPLNRKVGLNAFGSLYERDGAFAVRPDNNGASLNRERFDRSMSVSFDISSDSLDKRTEFGYRHVRQGSKLFYTYNGNFNYTGNGIFLNHERMLGNRIFKAEVDGNFTDYDNGYQEYHRFNTSVTLSTASLQKVYQVAVMTRFGYSKDFELLPTASFVYQSDYEKFFVQLSLGITTTEPSMHQLNLPSQQKSIYGSSTLEYSESGNSDLKKETALIASVTLEPGTVDNNLSVSFTGGKIKHAIEWSSELISGTPNVFAFIPVNDDLTFYTVSAKPRFRIADNLHFTGGGAYFYFDYDSLGARAFQPEYNVFSGLELHYRWEQRLVDLYAYGELMYTGPYQDYNGEQLGENVVANAKLTLGMKNFRFHVVFENVFDRYFETRDGYRNAGRVFYYGLVWNFFD